MSSSRTIGRVEAVFRYPIKSMAGERLAEAPIGWYGVEGDRRLAVRRVDESGGKPWLTASKLAELVLFTPLCAVPGGPATHVRLPDGRELPVDGAELAAEIARLYGKPVEMMRLDHGIFDETSISVISTGTVDAIGAACGRTLQVERFRPNVLVRTDEPSEFEEDTWVGAALSFGDDDSGPAVSITMRDERCAMLNLDHESARSDSEVLKAVVRLRDNKAGVYATVIRCGRMAVGQRVRLHAQTG